MGGCSLSSTILLSCAAFLCVLGRRRRALRVPNQEPGLDGSHMRQTKASQARTYISLNSRHTQRTLGCTSHSTFNASTTGR